MLPNPQNTLVYQCPFCQGRVEVAQELAGKTVNCPNPSCGQAFQAAVPVAQPAMDSEGMPQAPRDPEAMMRAATDEHELKILHPTMVRAHPLQFVFCLLLIVCGLSVTAVPSVIEHAFAVAQLSRVVGVGLALLGVAYLLLWWVGTLATTFTITNKRTILRRGIIARSTTEVRHDDVRNLQVHQGILQRILDVGAVAISSAGQDELEIYVRDIADPDGIAELIRKLQ
jgi:membrane protein YdbS with pleckstrin-like domain